VYFLDQASGLLAQLGRQGNGRARFLHQLPRRAD
jgi:hypothetical protein